MMKALLALTVLITTVQVSAASAVSEQRAPASQDITVVVEALTPLENAFDVTTKGGLIYHLENAARMSMSKMNALNASLDNGTTVKLRVDGKEILDIVLN